MKKICFARESQIERLRRFKLQKNKRRSRRTHKRNLRFKFQREDLARRFGSHSKILKLLEQKATRKIEVKQGISVTIPATFSIIDEPELVIETINQFAAVKLSGARPSQVYIDQSRMTSYDLAASALLDLVAVELKTELHLANRVSRFRGALPTSPEVSRFVKAIGIIKHLGIRDHLPTFSELEKLKIFDRRNRNYSKPTSAKTSSRKEKAASGFVDHINECLKTHDRVLTRAGITQLSGCIGELLDNAEEHAEFADWSMLGYLDLHRTQPKVEIAIFNFGRSIAQTFQDLPGTHYAWMSVKPYLDRHLGFRAITHRYRQEDLITVMALQEHVSSKNNDATGHRGHGTIQLLRFFNNLHQLCNETQVGPEMALLSGSTFIRFTGTHTITDSAKEEGIIAFNQQNSLDYPPSQKYVKGLGKTQFPGTIISIRFPLTAAMIEEE